MVRSEGDDIFSDYNMISGFQKAVSAFFLKSTFKTQDSWLGLSG
jgi:hypothetical protein